MNIYWNVFTDGGARGNPGPAGIGVVIEKCTDNICELTSQHHDFLGTATNNQAEYRALILALEELIKINPQEKVIFHLDSKLVVEQVNGNYKMKNPGLIPLFNEVNSLLKTFKTDVQFTHIPRERNKHADKLVNLAIDEGVRAKGE